MKIRFIEAVSNVSPKEIEQELMYVNRYKRKETEISYEIVKNAFPSIETEVQGLINGSQILKAVLRAEEEGVDGIFINCFDDPAVFPAREIARTPVLGPYKSSILFANTIGDRIAVISTDFFGTFNEEKKARLNNLSSLIKKIMYVDMGVLEFEENKLLEKLVEICIDLEKEGIDVAILGCTGMAFVIEKLRNELREKGCKLQIVEPLMTGILSLENILIGGYNNSISEKYINKEALKKYSLT